MTDGAVVVTGASTGIGRAVALHLRRRGFTVFGTVRTDGAAEALEGDGVRAVRMDVTDAGAVHAAARQVSREAPAGLAGLVNNAGIPCAGPLEHMPLDDVRRVFDVNVMGALAVTQAFLPQVRLARGRIVNISSVSARIAYPFLGPYGASKRALEALSDALRRELHPAGVDVVIVQPGSVRTPLWRKVAAMDADYATGTAYETVMERIRATALRGAGRGMDPERVAEAVDRALTAPRPPARIPVVRSRLKMRVMEWLPDRWLDGLIARRLSGGGRG